VGGVAGTVLGEHRVRVSGQLGPTVVIIDTARRALSGEHRVGVGGKLRHEHLHRQHPRFRKPARGERRRMGAGAIVVNGVLAVIVAMIPFRSFDIEITRRLSVSLFAAAGALLLSTLSLVGTGVSAGNMSYAAGVSEALWPLAIGAVSGLVSL